MLLYLLNILLKIEDFPFSTNVSTSILSQTKTIRKSAGINKASSKVIKGLTLHTILRVSDKLKVRNTTY